MSRVILGKFGKPHGVRGWLTIISYTDPTNAIVEYNPWQINHLGQWRELNPDLYRDTAKGVIVHLPGCDDRDHAKNYTHAEIAVFREQLPDLDDAFYWTDLVGMTVKHIDGTLLGQIKEMLATGAHDIMIVEGEQRHLIPWVMDEFIIKVDMDAREILVNWA